MHRLWLVLVAALMTVPALADPPECQPAVDMADSHDAVNRLDECDYSDEGINRWWGQGEDEPRDSSAASSSAASAAGAVRSAADRSIKRLRSQPLDGPLDLAKARYELLQRAADVCPQAARLERELYQRREEGALTLWVEFSCVAAP